METLEQLFCCNFPGLGAVAVDVAAGVDVVVAVVDLSNSKAAARRTF